MPVMRNAGGYVRVYRSLLDWEWYDDDACVRVMLHLLLTVNWETKRWHGQDVLPGQLITSMDSLAKELGMTRSSVRRVFDKLKSTGEVTTETNNHWTTVTVANWGEYQEQQPTNGRPKSQPATNQRPTADRPPATTEEVKHLRSKEGNVARAVVNMNFDDFRLACLSVHRSERILTDEQSKAFFDYWTEGHPDSKPRYARKDVFDIAKRMRTWAGRDAGRVPVLDQKPSTLKPWVN